MGVGKGSLARELSSVSGRFAVDTDDLIESSANETIKKIFDNQGEAAFRELECRLALWLEQGVSNAIISSGGGFYKVENLKKIGTIVYLDAPFVWIYRRLSQSPNAKKKIKKRPLFQDAEKAGKLYEARLPEYLACADIVFDVTQADSRGNAEKLFALLQQ